MIVGIVMSVDIMKVYLVWIVVMDCKGLILCSVIVFNFDVFV